MKKKMMTLICAMICMFAMSLNVFAAKSPEATPETKPSKPQTETAPKMGEENFALYGIFAAALLTGTAVISRKQLEKLN